MTTGSEPLFNTAPAPAFTVGMAAPVPPPSVSTVSEAIAHEIMRHRSPVFGIVGNGNIHVVSALTKAAHPYISARHESGALAMADAHYRAGGGIAVATTTYGPGVTNALTALSEAVAARIPLVYLAGDIPTTGARPIDVNQQALYRALGLPVIEVSAENATAATREAFSSAAQLRGPVVLSLPYDLVAQPVIDSIHRVERPIPPAVSVHALTAQNTSGQMAATSRDIRRLAGILREAHRPVILAGRGVVESHQEEMAKNIAEELGALVLTSAMAATALGTDWSAGIAGGFTHRGMLSLIEEADVVLVLGASLNRFQTRGSRLFNPEAKIYRIDIEPVPPVATCPVEELFVADLSLVLPLLHRALLEIPQQYNWRESMDELPAEELEELDPGCFAAKGEDNRLDPRFSLRKLNEILPAQRSVVTDGGHFIGWVPKYLKVPDPAAQILVGTGVMTIGLGFSSAAGVSVARPDRCTVLVTGDGGALMAMSDAETFIRTTGKGVIVIMNDAAYGAEIHQYVPRGLEASAMELADIDFAHLLSAFSTEGRVQGMTIEEPQDFDAIPEVLDQCLQEGRILVLDIKITRYAVADFLKEL